MTPTIDIIIPVYKGIESLQQCLESVIVNQQDVLFEVVLVDDASPEKGIPEYLDRMVETNDCVTVLRNDKNLGFVRSVNRGMALHANRDVILLNSDTIVANNWADRLKRCADEFPDTATVTPFSNNATICSFPHICRENLLPQGWSVSALDRVFSEVNGGESVTIPTAVGFCMYIKRECLDMIGQFDADTFDRGYGEENDFCMRASQRGWQHRLCADTLVYHVGSVSFRSEKDKWLSSALEILDKRYPKYHQTIQKHILKNPAGALRLKVWMALFKQSPRQKILFINHNQGGGTEKYMQELYSRKKEAVDVLILRPGDKGEVTINLGLENEVEGFTFSIPDEYSDLLALCRYFQVSRVHVHHIMGLDAVLLEMARDLDVPLDVTLHDYYFINANPTLTDNRGMFCSDRATRDSCCAKRYPVPGELTPEAWRKKQEVFLASADRIFSPSRYAAKELSNYFKGLNLVVTFHTDWEEDAPYPAVAPAAVKAKEKTRILVLGALSMEKGADVLEACVTLADTHNLALDFHLIGYAYRPWETAVKQHGAYHDDELDQLIAEYDPHLIWFPAMWPETYSYTLSAALRSGRPVAAPRIGAFPERLKNRPLTWLEEWTISANGWCDRFVSIRKEMSEADAAGIPLPWDGQPDAGAQDFSYSRDYVKGADLPLQTESFQFDDAWIQEHITHARRDRNGNTRLSRKENILVYLLKIRNNALIAAILNIVPYSVQTKIKRLLSRQPIYEYLLISDSGLAARNSRK